MSQRKEPGLPRRPILPESADPIAQVEAVLAAATPGPWRSWGMQMRASTCPERCADYEHSVLLADFYTNEDGRLRTFDLTFTTLARNLMPEALAVVRAAEAYREAEDARRVYGDHEGEWTLAVKRTRVALDAALSAFTERVQSGAES